MDFFTQLFGDSLLIFKIHKLAFVGEKLSADILIHQNRWNWQGFGEVLKLVRARLEVGIGFAICPREIEANVRAGSRDVVWVVLFVGIMGTKSEHFFDESDFFVDLRPNFVFHKLIDVIVDYVCFFDELRHKEIVGMT